VLTVEPILPGDLTRRDDLIKRIRWLAYDWSLTRPDARRGICVLIDEYDGVFAEPADDDFSLEPGGLRRLLGRSGW
jgi:hypothetical protein